MHTTLSQAVSALFDSTRVTWLTERPAQGAEPRADEVFLGIGSREAGLLPHPRMLSWKLPQWRAAKARSTTEVVMASGEVLDGLTLPLTLRVHEPTLDITTAALLVTYRVLHHAWPDGAALLRDYVSAWEQGQTEGAGHYERALASVFYASMHVFKTEGPGPARELVQLISSALATCPDTLHALPEALVPKRVTRRLKADQDLYRTELSRGWQVQLDVPLEAAADSPYRRVDALFLSSPQDVTVLKLLARPDQESSSYRRGFEVLAVHAPNESQGWARHTISIAPESPGTLTDLALRLDGLEGPLTPAGAPRPKGAARFSHQPAALEGLNDPWYSDGYAWERGRSTIVAPPWAGTKLSREAIWEALWQRFNVGRNVHVTAARSVFLRPFRCKPGVGLDTLTALGFGPSRWPEHVQGFLSSVSTSFLAATGGDVVHLSKASGANTLHVALYASKLALVWVEVVSVPTTLLELTTRQAALAAGGLDDALTELSVLESVGLDRWLVYGVYKINRARSTMLDRSRSVLGLFHALASGEAPTLENLPGETTIEAATVHRQRDIEHWFTSTGGARLELELEDDLSVPAIDHDFVLFLLTVGQRYAAFELSRRMAESERRTRTSAMASLRPAKDLRGDVMLFTNSLWYARVSDNPAIDARYDAWRALHDMGETVDALRSQTTELDEYRKERFENMMGILVFVFLPITIACGFFSGAQFNELSLSVGVPGSTGGWRIFLIYTAIFTVFVFGTVALGRIISSRRR